MAFLAALVDSLRRVVRSGVHQGVALVDGWGRGGEKSISEMTALRADVNQRLSRLGEGEIGGGGTGHPSNLLAMLGLSVSS